MKKNDVVLIVVILAIAAGLFFMIQKNKSKAEPDWVVVSVGSNEYARYPLNKDETYELKVHEGEVNILQVKDGVATMIEANCSDQICVYQKGISQNGEMIICLPHQLIITIDSSIEKTNDSVAN